jgi:hypothetical protein
MNFDRRVRRAALSFHPRLKVASQSENKTEVILIVTHFIHFFANHQMGQSSLPDGKVKVTFSLEQATKAQRGSRGIALLFL